MAAFLADFRYSLRSLARSRAFSFVAVLTLALGIGASAAIYSVVHAVLLRPLPYPSPGQIVRVWEQAPNGRRMSFAEPNFLDFAAQNRSFAALGEYEAGPVSVSGGSEPVRVTAADVSPGFFPAFAVPPLRGRSFTAEEQRPHGAPAALVSYSYWQRYLGGASDLARFHLSLEGGVYPVVGVMPETFDYPAGAAIWIPNREDPETSRSSHNWRGVGRLRDGVTVDQARADLSAIARAIKDRYGKDADLNAAAVVPLADAMVGDVRTALLTLLAAVALLLAVACANVAGLLVARTGARRREFAVRAALGAGRARLIQQFLAESLTLSAFAGALGLALAFAAVRFFPAILPVTLPRREGIALDAPVLLFALAATTAVALALGLFAAFRAAAGDLHQALASGSRGNTAGATQRLRGALVVAEIAATLVILIGAALLGRSFLRLTAVSPGFRPDNLVTVEFSLPSHSWAETPSPAAQARQIQQMDDLLARLRGIPGVRSAGIASAMPVAAGDDLPNGTFLLLHGHPSPANIKEWARMAHDPALTGQALYCVAGEAWFRTLEIPLVRGRLFDPHATPDGPHAALVSQALARQRWPNEDPIGQTINFGNMDGNLKPYVIAGIVGDIRAQGLDLPPGPIIYSDYRQRGFRASASPTVVLRAAVPLVEIAPAARAIFHDLSPDTPVKFSTFDSEMTGWLSGRRFLLLLTGVFAAAALSLAAVGIYGVVAFSVARRTQEIGIRVALGAARRDVLRLILGEGARLALSGVALGLAASLLLTRLVSSLFYGVSPTDPATFAAVAAVLAFVALLASYLPARRALRLDPNTALRYE